MVEPDEIKIILNSLKGGVLYEVTRICPYLPTLSACDWSGTIFTDCLAVTHNRGAIYTRVRIHPSLDQFIDSNVSNVGTVLITTKGDEVEVLMGLQYTLQHHLIKHVIAKIYPSMRPVHVYLNLLLKMSKWGYCIYHINHQDQPKIEPYNLENLYDESEKTLLISDNSSTSS